METNGWFERILDSARDHYACFLPGRTGFISSLFLRSLFSKIRLDDDQMNAVRQLPEDAIVVYVSKHKSDFERFFCHTRYGDYGPRRPELAFDYHTVFFQPLSRIFKIALFRFLYLVRFRMPPNPYAAEYIRKQLLESRSALLSLMEKKDFYRRYVKAKTDPLEYLIRMRRETGSPVYLVPQLLLFGRKPPPSVPGIIDILFGHEYKPGLARRLFTLLRKPEKIFLELSGPVDLGEFVSQMDGPYTSDAQMALALRRTLMRQINRHRQSITGPVLKTDEELKQSVLTMDDLRRFMEKHAERRNTSIYAAQKEALGYLNEIAAKYSATFVSVGIRIVRRLLGNVFERIVFNKERLDSAKALSRRGPLILVPCHRSHFDYVLLSYILYNNNMPCPHIFAGANLSFWPAGPIFRRAGAFFVRRSFAGAVFYSKVFSAYIRKLLEEGFNIAVFIEGTRSRTGKMLLPQLGMLGILLDAFKSGACEDLIFVPISIGYDRVPEEGAYVDEIEGREKKTENLWQLIRAGKILKRNFGKTYMKFEKPFALNDVLAENGKTIGELTSKAKNELCRNLGHRIMDTIDRSAVVTPQALVACAALNHPKAIIGFDDILMFVENCLAYLHAENANLSESLIADPSGAVSHITDYYVQRKCLEKVSLKNGGENTRRYLINRNRRIELEYYKNNVVSAFIPVAFTSLAILEKDAFQFPASDLHPEFRFLRDLFCNEFARTQSATPEYQVRKTVKTFIDDAVLIPHATLPDTYSITSPGLRKLRMFASFLKTFLEAYLVVLIYFGRTPKKKDDKKKRLKKIRSIGNRMYKRNTIERTEALSTAYFENAAQFFTRNGVKGAEDEEKLDFYKARIERYLSRMG